MPRQLTPSGGTAKTLILVGLIFDLIFVLIFWGISLPVVIVSGFFFVPFLGFFVIAGVIGILVLYLVYAFSYKRARDGDYEGARTPTLIWAILSLITINIIPGILYLIAYVKLGDAVRESQAPAYGMPYPQAGYPPMMPPAGAPMAAPPAAAPAAAAAAPGASPAPVCPRCGTPATYIAQYGRWYCYRDQTYL